MLRPKKTTHVAATCVVLGKSLLQQIIFTFKCSHRWHIQWYMQNRQHEQHPEKTATSSTHCTMLPTWNTRSTDHMTFYKSSVPLSFKHANYNRPSNGSCRH